MIKKLAKSSGLLKNCIEDDDNYMDIGCLMQICCTIIASSMIDQSVDEVQKAFGIEEDLTEE